MFGDPKAVENRTVMKSIPLLAGWFILLLTARWSFAATDYPVASSPYSVVAADVNGDGKPDLICASHGAGHGADTLTVWTNNGSGLFGSNATYSVGSVTKYVTAADVNGDGWVDLICANYGSNTLSVLTNDAHGGFVLASTPSTSANGLNDIEPEMVLAADVNGDGQMDLITPNRWTGSLSVLTNDGSGGFKIASVLLCTNGQGTFSVASADVNGDGWVDLICANYNTNTLTIFTNDGSGGFKLSSTPTVGTNPNTVIAADVNGDHKMDLICANVGSPSAYPLSVSVLTNNGSGGFGSNATYQVDGGSAAANVYSGSSLIAATDFNGDGKVDLLCVDYAFGTLLIYTNNGSGGFHLFNSSPAPSSIPYAVIAADVNGDGKPDVVYVDQSYNQMVVVTNWVGFSPPSSQPAVSIRSSGKRLLASWPSASAGWSLQQCPDITASNWSPSGYNGHPVADDGTNKSLVIVPQAGNLFFRLLHP